MFQKFERLLWGVGMDLSGGGLEFNQRAILISHRDREKAESMQFMKTQRDTSESLVWLQMKPSHVSVTALLLVSCRCYSSWGRLGFRLALCAQTSVKIVKNAICSHLVALYVLLHGLVGLVSKSFTTTPTVLLGEPSIVRQKSLGTTGQWHHQPIDRLLRGCHRTTWFRVQWLIFSVTSTSDMDQ